MTFRGRASATLLIPAFAVMACLGTGVTPGIPSETADPELPATQPVTSAPAPTREVTPTPASTQPPSEAAFDWGGDWTIYKPVSGDNIDQALFVISGDSLTGGFTSGEPGYEEVVTLTGTLTADGSGVSGTWQNLTYGNSGPFRWQFVAENGHQFVGSWEFVDSDPQPFCGFRSGAPQPNPCMSP